nr:MAG TPA: hypothetical protein [Caudoviricetes sp.]
MEIRAGPQRSFFILKIAPAQEGRTMWKQL